YDLTDPHHPTLVANPQFGHQIGGGPAFYVGNVGWVPTSVYFYNPFSNFIFAQSGDFFGVDFTNPAMPVEAGRLFPMTPPGGDGLSNGPTMIFAALDVAGNVAYLSTTTATGDGFGTGPGVGRLFVVDVTNPDAPTQTGELLWPAQGPVVLQSAAVDGQ